MILLLVEILGVLCTAYLHKRACPHMHRTSFEAVFDVCILIVAWPVILVIIWLGWIGNLVLKLIERENHVP